MANNTPQKNHFINILTGKTFPFQYDTLKPQDKYCPFSG